MASIHEIKKWQKSRDTAPLNSLLKRQSDEIGITFMLKGQREEIFPRNWFAPRQRGEILYVCPLFKLPGL